MICDSRHRPRKLHPINLYALLKRHRPRFATPYPLFNINQHDIILAMPMTTEPDRIMSPSSRIYISPDCHIQLTNSTAVMDQSLVSDAR